MQAGTLDRLVMAGGDVAIQNNTAVKSIEIQTGTLYDDVQATSHALIVPKGKSATWQLTGVYYTAYANKLSGAGTLTIIPRNTVQRVRITGDWSQFEGTVKHITKTICLPFDNSTGMPNATLDVAEGCSVSNVCKSFAIGRLTGKGALLQPIADFKSQAAVSGNNTWNVGNSWETGGDFTFEGTFKDEGGTNKCLFNKVGTCKMTVSGKSTHSGATHIKGGELCLKSGATLGTGTLSVDKNATLSGVTASSGLTNSSYTIANGGTLRVGSSSTATTGIIRFGGKNVNFASGAVLELGVSQAADNNNTGGTSIQNISRLTMNGTIRFHYDPTAAENLSVGDSIVLWKDVTSFEGKPILESNIIDAEKCLVWDAVDLNKGILRVAYDNALNIIDEIKEKNSGKQPVYTLDGRRISNIRNGQINIVGGQKIYQRP
jgi:autotransporter-associated beta strand protein